MPHAAPIASDGELLSGLTDDQRAAVTTEATPLLVLAGAGSGKTRVLTRRIAWHAQAGSVDPRRVLAVTFTRKAAAELTSRLTDLGLDDEVTAGTFHALAFAQLRRWWLDRGRPVPALLERKTRLLARLARPGTGGAQVLGQAAREIEWAQARLVPPADYEAAARAAGRTPPLEPSVLEGLYEAYVEAKARRGLVDFEDLLVQCAAAIEEDAELAAAAHWRFRHVFVDEFQDVSPAQFRLLRAWLGDRADLFAVGDDDQAIYGFGGADARYVRDFREYFGARAGVLRLSANFRSTPEILALANAIIHPAPGDERRLRPTASEGPPPTLSAYADDRAEADGVARGVVQLRSDGVAHRDVAVLARTNAQCDLLSQALAAAGVPCRRVAAARYLDRPAVAAALSAIDDDVRGGASLDETVSTRLRLATVEAEVESLRVLAEEYVGLEGPAATPEGLREFVAAVMRDEDPGPRPDAVDVLTFHRAKGLEWPVVFVTGLEEGFVPISHAVTEALRAEERRLLHVALTRARRRLALSWARRRTFGSSAVERVCSPFLAGLDHFIPSDEATSSAAGAASGLAEASAALSASRASAPSAGATPDPLLAALVDWRARRARAASVPAAAVLDDDTIRAIAVQRPRDEVALRALPGALPVRLARYAPEILALVEEYAGS